MSRKSTRRIPSYRLHKATGQAVVTLAGKDHYLGPHGTQASKDEYDRLTSVFLASGRRMPSEGDATGLTVVELVARFIAHAKQHYRKPDGRPTSEVGCIKAALKPLLALYGREPVSEFGPLKLKAIRQTLIDSGKARKSINHNVRRIVRAFRWGVAEELVAPGVVQALEAVQGLQRGRSEARETEPVRPVEEAHVDAVLAIVTPQVRALVQLMWLTGMRVGEVTIMRTGDLDRSGTTWIYTPSTHKTEHHGQVREVPLGPKAQEVLRPFLKADPAAYMFSPREAVQEADRARREARRTPMTPSQYRRACEAAARPKRKLREHYTPATVRQAIVRACDKAGVPRWTSHQLRHSAATRFRREFGIEEARVVLGHSSAFVTEVYAEVDRSKARDIMSRVG